MADRRSSPAGPPESNLEQALFDLADYVAWPNTPEIAGRVHASLEPAVVPPHPNFDFVAHRRVWLAAACIVAAIVVGLAVFPEARSAIADRLGLRGVHIRWVDEGPLPPPSPIGATMMLGREVTMQEAQEAVDFPLQLPMGDGFENPGEIYLLGQGENAMVSFVYPARPGLPESELTGVGALLTQFAGETERGFIEKGMAAKTIDPQAILEYVRVGDDRGYWITGAPHGFFLVCGDDDTCREERYRLAGNVLLWEHEGLTLRLEAALTRDEATAIAQTVRAVE